MTNSRRAALLALLSALAFGLLLVAMLLPGVTPWSPPTKAAAEAAVKAQTCTVHLYALDSGKESPYAFGPPVAARSEAGIKAELHKTRTCDPSTGQLTGDPVITASHYAEWSEVGRKHGLQLTSQDVNYGDIDAFAASLVANQPKWQAVEKELEQLENSWRFGTETVPAGVWTLYMVPDGHGGVTTHQGFTIGVGTNVVFTHGDMAIRYRLDCRFQPNVPGAGFGISNVPPGHPETPVCPPGTMGTPPANCVPVCEYNSTLPASSLSCVPPSCPPGTKGTPPNDCYVPCWNGQRPWPGGGCSKISSEDVGVNPRVDKWKQDATGGNASSGHQTSTGNGATASNGYQGDPAAAAQKAAEQAQQTQQQTEQQHQAAIDQADTSGGGTVDTNQDHTAATDPNTDGSGW